MQSFAQGDDDSVHVIFTPHNAVLLTEHVVFCLLAMGPDFFGPYPSNVPLYFTESILAVLYLSLNFKYNTCC
jgi:hypothetical protein